MHPWHDIPLDRTEQDRFAMVVETPRGSRVQYALDLETGLLRVRRVLFAAAHFPANYGFAPRTLSDDGEPADVLVLGQSAIAPLTIAQARPIGLLCLEKAAGRDDKIIAVHVDDPVFAFYRGLSDLPGHLRAQIERFFDDYRVLEGVGVTTCGFGGPEEARSLLTAASERYAARSSAAVPGPS
jgi:inorganic pyrophosphatase